MKRPIFCFCLLFGCLSTASALLAQDEPQPTLGAIEKARVTKSIENYCRELIAHGKGDDPAIVALFDMFLTPSQLVYDDIDLYKREENIELSRYLTRIKRKYSGQLNIRFLTDLKDLRFYLKQMDTREVAMAKVEKSVTGAGFNERVENYIIVDTKTGKIVNILKELLPGAIPADQEEKEATTTEEEAEKVKEAPRADELPIEMVYVKGGVFRMGDQYGHPDEKPVHVVEMSDYYIGMYEVTQQQWQQVMGENPSKYQEDCAQCPVEQVSYDQVQVFLDSLNARTKLNYRLPTEAEWEYAAKGGTETGGFRFSGSHKAHEVGWYKDNSRMKIHPVGTKAPNELNIFDMTGNISEWVADWYGPYVIDRQQNPMGPIEGERKVIRGGSFYNSDDYCRTSERGNAAPHLSMYFIGFRLAMDAPD